MPPMMQPMMMPYHPTPMMPPMMDKGYGKGVGYPAPMPPMTPPSMPPPAHQPGATAPMQVPTWAPNMQMMPIPVPPAVPMSSAPPSQEQKTDSQAQKKLNKLLPATCHEEGGGHAIAQPPVYGPRNAKKDERDNTMATISAVKGLGDAKEALLEAENARARSLSGRPSCGNRIKFSLQ